MRVMASFACSDSDIADAEILYQLKPGGNPNDQKAGAETWCAAFAPDNSYFAWSCGHRLVRLVPWKHKINNNEIEDEEGRQGEPMLPTPKEKVIDCGEYVWAVAFGSSVSSKCHRTVNISFHRFNFGKDLILATGLQSGRIKTWDVSSGGILLYLIDHKEVIRDLQFAPDGSMFLASASRDKTLKVWDLNDDGNMKKTLKGHNGWVYSCSWSPDAKILASVGQNKTVILWDMSDYSMMRKLTGHQNDVVACDFSPDGALLATGSYDTRVILWDPYTGQKIRTFGHMYPPPSFLMMGGANDYWLRALSFSHDGCHVGTLCDDKYVRFWSIYNEEVPVKKAQLVNALCCNYSPDGCCLATGTRDGNVVFYMAPMRVQKLQHLCRLSVRRVLPSTRVDALPIPQKLMGYLKYEN
ncbi:PREDICTED: WD repeat and SOCS box-containing protein 1-like isoform X4 [Branchiostoma belcheri]|uniref:WD repeat and SOCS box-containing protein 1-like isoform X4 n=1 Tax=Branchiostoma belcheri TaxID=7741 RepID=A0A6P4Y2H4_BRABE|nr:PREDICTED: WD repeat and SOCS box-containing protein 1-like isoform X4 [Branchiostoma belcheri]